MGWAKDQLVAGIRRGQVQWGLQPGRYAAIVSQSNPICLQRPLSEDLHTDPSRICCHSSCCMPARACHQSMVHRLSS